MLSTTITVIAFILIVLMGLKTFVFDSPEKESYRQGFEDGRNFEALVNTRKIYVIKNNQWKLLGEDANGETTSSIQEFEGEEQ